jgi:hypothetical protein
VTQVAKGECRKLIVTRHGIPFLEITACKVERPSKKK